MSWKDDLNYGLAAFGVQIPERIDIDSWAASLTEKPLTSTSSLVGICSVLFFIAERDHNPKVTSVYDALVYCSTCLNVGYADIFARTPVGKLIGSFLMTIGPSMATKTTDGTGPANDANRQEQILTLLRQIAERLPQNGPPQSTSEAN